MPYSVSELSPYKTNTVAAGNYSTNVPHLVLGFGVATAILHARIRHRSVINGFGDNLDLF